MNNIIILIPLFIYLFYIIFIKEYRIKRPGFSNEYNNISLENIIKKNINFPTVKKNIIFFFSVSYDIIPSYYEKSFEIFSYYCNLHNYKLFFFNHYKENHKMSPIWIRVADFIKLTNQYEESPNTIFVYLDIDTFINPKYLNVKISNIINSVDRIDNYYNDIYIGNDPVYESNAGVIIVKNTKWSKKFLKHWLSKYNTNNWKFKDNKWTCKRDKFIFNIPYKSECYWGEDDYEQGEFNSIYRNNELNSQNHIKILHHSLISNNCINIDSFIYHFYAKDKIGNINEMHKKFIQYLNK
jgi:hypothetical protein